MKQLLFVTILALLMLSSIQFLFPVIKLPELKGAIAKPEKVQFYVKEWFNGTYQKKEESYLNEMFGFRNFFVRLNNQIAFSLFNKAKANGVIIGKHNYLYEEAYIKAYYGEDFIGLDSIRHQVKQLKLIQDNLATRKKTFMLVFAAGKGSFYPEFIPDKYKKEKGPTNYEVYIKTAKEFKLNFIDFNKYFIDHKQTSTYPLYPQYGIHWSFYGMCLAADSIVRYIEDIRHIDLPNFYWNKVAMDAPKETDYDIADGMNILFRLKTFKMAYPVIEFEPDSGKDNISVLVIADSYYWGMFGSAIISRSFASNDFWYYNQQQYTAGTSSETAVNSFNLADKIMEYDVIIILSTDANLHSLGWGFIGNAANLFE